MKSIVLLIGSRVVNGIFGLLLLMLLKDMIAGNAYGNFSSNYAYLTMLSALGGGVLGGLILKNAFLIDAGDKKVIWFYLLLFLLIMTVALEISLVWHVFAGLSRSSTYSFIILHLISSAALIHFQLKQQFLRMTAIELFRTLVPLAIVVFMRAFTAGSGLSSDQVILLFSLGNLPGVILFFMIAFNHAGESIPLRGYLKQKLRSDLSFGFSFAAFNSLAQLIIASDRSLVVMNNKPDVSTKIAYTADQVTRVANGILFPLNTKISSELGRMIRDARVNVFYKQLHNYTLATLGIGIFGTGVIYGTVYLFSHIKVFGDLELYSILSYGTANAIYLTCLIYQKRYDYTRYKALPVILLASAAIIAWLFSRYIWPAASFFLISALVFGMLLIVSGVVLPRHKLKLNL